MAQIKIEFEKGGVFYARLLEEKAPKTCQTIKAHLPFEYRFHHSITSGNGILTISPDLTIEREHQWVMGIPAGSLTFLVKDEPVLVPDELFITYGIFVPRGLTIDMNQPVNVFGQVEENLDELGAACRRVLMSGAERVRFSLA